MRREDIPEKYRIENVKGWRFIVPDEILYENIHDSNAVLESIKKAYLYPDVESDDPVYDDPNMFKVHDNITYNQ